MASDQDSFIEKEGPEEQIIFKELREKSSSGGRIVAANMQCSVEGVFSQERMVWTKRSTYVNMWLGSQVGITSLGAV